MPLPPEILDLVCDHHRPKELLEWMCVSRSLSNIATPKLYDTVHLYNDRVIDRLVERLTQRPDLVKYVRRVILYPDGQKTPHEAVESVYFMQLRQLTTPFVEYFDFPRGYTGIWSTDPWSHLTEHPWPHLKHVPSAWPTERGFNHIPFDGWHRLKSLTCRASDLFRRQNEMLPCLVSLVLLYHPDREPERRLHAVFDIVHAVAPAISQLVVRADPERGIDTWHLLPRLQEGDEQLDGMTTSQPVRGLRALTLDVLVFDEEMSDFLAKKYPCLSSLSVRVLHRCPLFRKDGSMVLERWLSLKKMDLDLSGRHALLDQQLDAVAPSVLVQRVAWRLDLPSTTLMPSLVVTEQLVDLSLLVKTWSVSRCWLGLCEFDDGGSDAMCHHNGTHFNFPHLKRLRLDGGDYMGRDRDNDDLVKTLGPLSLYAVLSKFSRLACLELANLSLDSPPNVGEFALPLPRASECHAHLRRLSLRSTTLDSAAVLQDLLNRCPHAVDLQLHGVCFMATRSPIVIDTPDREYDLVNTFDTSYVLRPNRYPAPSREPNIRIDFVPPGTTRNIRKTCAIHGANELNDDCTAVRVQELISPDAQATHDDATQCKGKRNNEKKKEKKERKFIHWIKNGLTSSASSHESTTQLAYLDIVYFAIRCRSVARLAHTNIGQFFEKSHIWDFDHVHSEQ
ncbi:hypothetical protein BC940DRAFT_310613 [Gongronella butleri]|nr:hypothetical protein BC940DRAFT_310613 [Gongronella butleri]